MPKVSRLPKTADQGPQITDEYLYTVVDALERLAQRSADRSGSGAELGVAKANRFIGDHRRRMKSNCGRIWAPQAGILTAEQVAVLDKASELTAAYPIGIREKTFSGRNPLPV